MFERTGGYYLPLAIGAKVAFARGVAQLPEDLTSQAPTVDVRGAAHLRALPRAHRAGARGFAGEARAVRRVRRARLSRRDAATASALDRLLVPLLRSVVAARSSRASAGACASPSSAARALDPTLARTFIGLGLPVLQGYGMTEASPVVSVNRTDDNVPESVGPPLDDVEVRLGEADELLVRGPNVMLGYWHDPEATARALDADGWLHTGDLAEIVGGQHRHPRPREGHPRAVERREAAAAGRGVRDPARPRVRAGDAGRRRPAVPRAGRGDRETDEKELVKRANERLGHFPR